MIQNSEKIWMLSIVDRDVSYSSWIAVENDFIEKIVASRKMKWSKWNVYEHKYFIRSKELRLLSDIIG